VQDREGERERERENVYAWIAVIASSSSHEFSRLSLSVSFSARSIFNSISTHSRASLASFPVLHPPPRAPSFSATRFLPVLVYARRLFTSNRYYLESHRFSSSRSKRRKTRLAIGTRISFFLLSLSPPPLSLSFSLSYAKKSPSMQAGS
jgi:hypothetical protein